MQLAFGQAAEQRGDQDAAIAAYRNTLNKDPSSVAAMHGLAIALDKNGKNKKATQLYLEALELAPENAMVHADLGYSLSLQRDLQGAEFHLKKALELNPEIVQARNNLALVLARSGRFDEALRAFEANGLSESQARSNLAAMMLMEGEVDLASAEITRAKQAHIYGPPPEILHRVAALVERAQTEARPRLTGDGVRR